MNELITNAEKLTMSSREIAELVNSRHDKVKQSIERLVSKGIIDQPPMGDGQKSANQVVEKVYLFTGEQGKRDSYVVVAQLSPEFTAKLVDRWQELEAQQSPQLAIPQDYSSALRLAADLHDKNQALEHKVEQDAPKVEYADSLLGADVAKNMDEVAKSLALKGWGRNKIFELLRDKGYLMSGARKNQPYQEYVNRGYFKTELRKFDRGGTEDFHVKTMVLPKGIDLIRKLIAKEMEVA